MLPGPPTCGECWESSLSLLKGDIDGSANICKLNINLADYSRYYSLLSYIQLTCTFESEKYRVLFGYFLFSLSPKVHLRNIVPRKNALKQQPQRKQNIQYVIILGKIIKHVVVAAHRLI